MEEEEYSSIEEDYDEKIRLMVIGDANVGKTSLIKRYCQNDFNNAYLTTIGIDFQTKNINMNNKNIKIQIWDTAGQERYRIMAKNYYNSSDGFIIVYDITKRESFNNINTWIEQISNSAQNYSKSVIFANKCDLKDIRKVKIDEGKELAKQYNFKFYETSAKDSINIKEGFESIIKNILGDIQSIKSVRKNTVSLRDQKHKNKEKEKCC